MRILPNRDIVLLLLLMWTLLSASCGAGNSPQAAMLPTQPTSPTAVPLTPTPEAPTATATALPSKTPLPPTTTIEPTVTIEPTTTPLPPTPTRLPPLSGSGGGVIAFVSEKDGVPGIHIMNADGSDQRQLTNKFDAHPDWSPDGSQIAFSTRRKNEVAIYKIDLETNETQRLTNTDRAPSAPDWSPDGQRFAMIFNPAHPGINWELYLMNADGKKFVRLTNSAGYQTYASPDWSPDGNRIVFAADLDDNDNIYLMDPNGSNVQQLTFDESNDRSPAWSPDGTEIAFETYRDGNWEIYAMNADGSNLRNLSNSPSRELWPSWSPDGLRLAFQSDRDGNWEIYLMNADGHEQLRLTDNNVKDSEPAWKP